MSSPKQFRLFRGDEVLGTVTVKECDWPWTIGAFSPAPPFEALRELFQKAWDYSAESDWDRCDPILGELEKPGLTLHDVETNEITGVLGFQCNGSEFHWLDDNGENE